MFEIAPVEGGVVELTVTGRIDADSMRDGLNALWGALEPVESARLLLLYNDWELPTAGALAVEFGQLGRAFSILAKVDRAALVSNQDWLRRVAEIESALIPGLEIRTYVPEDEAAARAWLAES
ncbi:STAS/SEC14 domain-containing protein [Pontivivens ytuae]|uniref:STAS/SEC14 domain-containing protein n=1 Tax=Pontivivens ytuae TaxID=2789856 RepID=A0A7S9LPY2_9RHOB|nr:STAS/SEC14 domain-containing protein [Pontivivens ytuae]QPH53144.1 STAS/SEC14 domain-containing protein [Pontivivens ytuae]